MSFINVTRGILDLLLCWLIMLIYHITFITGMLLSDFYQYVFWEASNLLRNAKGMNLLKIPGIYFIHSYKVLNISNTVVLITLFIELPASSIAFIFFSTCSVCSSIVFQQYLHFRVWNLT